MVLPPPASNRMTIGNAYKQTHRQPRICKRLEVAWRSVLAYDDGRDVWTYLVEAVHRVLARIRQSRSSTDQARQQQVAATNHEPYSYPNSLTCHRSFGLSSFETTFALYAAETLLNRRKTIPTIVTAVEYSCEKNNLSLTTFDISWAAFIHCFIHFFPVTKDILVSCTCCSLSTLIWPWSAMADYSLAIFLLIFISVPIQYYLSPSHSELKWHLTKYVA